MPEPTSKQSAYLQFIRNYVAVHRRAPAEADMQAHFRTSPPAVHRMVMALAEKGLIRREAGKARSIEVVDDIAANRDATGRRPPDDIHPPLDPEIAPLVEALRAESWVTTKGSCSGHGKKAAYVDLAVDGLEGLQRFVARLNVLDRELETEALFDVALSWSERVVTACAFDLFPTWIMLSWSIEGMSKRGAPSTELLTKVAATYRAAREDAPWGVARLGPRSRGARRRP